MTGRQLVTSPESEESSLSTSVNTNMKLLSYLQREKLKVPQKRARQEEEEDDTEEEEEEVEQSFVEMRALEVEEIEKDDKDEDLEKILHTQQNCTLVTFFKLIESHRDKIPSEAWQLISQTCFGEMINAFRTRRIVADQVSRFELDIEILLRHYCKETKKFMFGEKEMEIKEEDVHLLFGLTKECENEEEKICRRKKSSQQSTIFGKTKGSIFRKMIHDKLTEELNKIKNKEAEPRKIASLIIMNLLATFFFSTSGSQIEWQLVLICEDLEAINKINWSRKVIEAFHEGVKKHVKGKPKGLNGCVVLPLYCFLERTKIKEKIQKKQADMPRFVRWSTNGIIYRSDYLKRPKKLEELVAQGPWKDEEERTSGSEEYGTPDEHGTPSFEEWAVIHDEQPLNHVSPVIDYEDLPLTDDDICNLDKIVESQAASIRQSATENDNVISATV
ncbi:hypothetical protein ACLB2K_011816 [Fragaria x ananassa]